MKPFYQKTLLIIAGLLVAVLLGELFFRISGAIIHEKKLPTAGEDRTTYKILCLGDSSTYGYGASDVKKFSYPSQLQTILEKKIPSQHFKVINLGIPGMNSSQVLNRLRENILRYDPDLLIIMAGINDPWNLEESTILKFYNTGILKKTFLNIGYALNKLKLYRFVKLVLISRELNKPKTAPRIIPFNSKSREKGFIFSPRSAPEKSSVLYYSIKWNIKEMLRTAQDYNLDILFMKYHNIGWGRPEKIIHQTYHELDMTVVDNEKLFAETERLGIDIRGNDGWHPNDLGYLLIAANVYNRLVASKYVDGEPVKIKFSAKNQ